MMKWNNSFNSFATIKKDTDNSGVEELNDKKLKLFKEKTYQVIKELEKLKLPKQNEQIRLIAFRTFNASVFLEHICSKTKIEKLILVVYSINAEAAICINDLINQGKIKSCKILMSNLRNKAHRSKEQLVRDLFVDNPKIELFFASCHSKIMSMATEDGNYYTVEGSGNLSFNSRIEQYILDNDKELFNFTEHWTEEVKTYLAGKKDLVLT